MTSLYGKHQQPELILNSLYKCETSHNYSCMYTYHLLALLHPSVLVVAIHPAARALPCVLQLVQLVSVHHSTHIWTAANQRYILSLLLHCINCHTWRNIFGSSIHDKYSLVLIILARPPTRTYSAEQVLTYCLAGHWIRNCVWCNRTEGRKAAQQGSRRDYQAVKG